mgnify:CR=1 FL=1
MKAFVLEDDPERIKQFKKRFAEKNWEYVIVSDVVSAIKALSTITFNILFLDHDLGGEVYVDILNSNTGSELARWISDNGVKGDPVVIIHSLNTVGQAYMSSLIKNPFVIPFVWTKNIFDSKIQIGKEDNDV